MYKTIQININFDVVSHKNICVSVEHPKDKKNAELLMRQTMDSLEIKDNAFSFEWTDSHNGLLHVLDDSINISFLCEKLRENK